MQGVTELWQCERGDDEWLKEVQEELRHGKLSANTHKFLHSEPTSVPGSWVRDDFYMWEGRLQEVGHSISRQAFIKFQRQAEVQTDSQTILQQELGVRFPSGKSVPVLGGPFS